jgi:hypothetical protein
MRNPSYLIKSRHGIYYFRYPLPIKRFSEECRVSISLRTRCPREALRLAKALEYHSIVLFKGMSLDHMSSKEILEIVKRYYAKKLDGFKQMADNGVFLDGPSVNMLKKELKNMNRVIEGGYRDYDEMRGIYDEDSPYSSINEARKIIKDAGVEIAEDSDEFILLRGLIKFAARNCLRDWIEYNEQKTNFSFFDEGAASPAVGNGNATLGHVIEKYLDEIKPDLKGAYKSGRSKGVRTITGKAIWR